MNNTTTFFGQFINDAVASHASGLLNTHTDFGKKSMLNLRTDLHTDRELPNLYVTNYTASLYWA